MLLYRKQKKRGSGMDLSGVSSALEGIGITVDGRCEKKKLGLPYVGDVLVRDMFGECRADGIEEKKIALEDDKVLPVVREKDIPLYRWVYKNKDKIFIVEDEDPLEFFGLFLEYSPLNMRYRLQGNNAIWWMSSLDLMKRFPTGCEDDGLYNQMLHGYRLYGEKARRFLDRLGSAVDFIPLIIKKEKAVFINKYYESKPRMSFGGNIAKDKDVMERLRKQYDTFSLNENKWYYVFSGKSGYLYIKSVPESEIA